ncbi:hemagglutinin repeat-containing protein [Xanthomonas sp. PPL139]
MSQVSAGGNLTLLASDGSITSQGTQLSAEGNALLLASQNIDLGVAHTTESSGNDSQRQCPKTIKIILKLRFFVRV